MRWALAAILFGEMMVIYFSLTELLVLCHRALHHSPARRNGWVHQSQWIYTYSIKITSSLCQFVIRLVLGMQSLLHDAIFLHFSLLFADQRSWFQWNKRWTRQQKETDQTVSQNSCPLQYFHRVNFYNSLRRSRELTVFYSAGLQKEREKKRQLRLLSGLFKHPQLFLHFWAFLMLTMREKTLEN